MSRGPVPSYEGRKEEISTRVREYVDEFDFLSAVLTWRGYFVLYTYHVLSVEM